MTRFVREGYIPDAENPSTVLASSRTSPLLQDTANTRRSDRGGDPPCSRRLVMQKSALDSGRRP
ncbi:hypothetical protein CCL22_26890 [Pseudomonas syringae]|nr:hypothetical protein CCL22_26890 [Pseudomonas syringae]